MKGITGRSVKSINKVHLGNKDIKNTFQEEGTHTERYIRGQLKAFTEERSSLMQRQAAIRSCDLCHHSFLLSRNEGHGSRLLKAKRDRKKNKVSNKALILIA